MAALNAFAQGTAQIAEITGSQPTQAVNEKVNDVIEPIDISFVDAIKASANDTLYIINFWATWCKPCVEELPHFERIRDMFPGQKLRIVLISTDSRKMYETKLKEFVQKKNMQCEVLWMRAGNPDAWINTVDEQWSGAIPATLILKPKIGFTWFKEGEITFNELMQLTTQVINQ
jgi:thiol-disulfide isomerase/thioredoxin